MKNFFESQIIHSKFLEMSTLDLMLTLLTFTSVIFLSFVTKRFLLSKKLEKFVIYFIRRKISSFLIILFWLIAITIVIEINTEEFYQYRFFKNKYIEITTLSILTSVFFITLNLLIIYLFKIAQRKLNVSYENAENLVKSTFRLVQTIFWIITVSIVLKSFLRNFNHFINYKFFKINKIDITTGDFIFAILVIVIGQMILVGLKGFFRHQVNQKKIDLGTSHSIFRILKYLIWLILLGIILESAGFKLSLLLAGSAALLVGLGFGIQQLFSDFVSGLVIIAEGTVKVGDIVDVDGVVGKVIESDLRTTKILTPDSTTIILPNTQLTANKLINNTNTDTKTRFRVAVGVAYGSDIELVERLLKECASEHKNILTEPAPSVIFKDFGESSLDFELLFWSNDEFVIQLVKSDLRKAIYHKFNQNKIVIPFPQRDVYIYNK